jgi:hypothetical protein
MDRGASPAQTPAPGDFPTESGPGPLPLPGTEAPSGPVVDLGGALVQTIRHFWPDFNAWLDRIPDPRSPRLLIYDKRFLTWWGVSLYLFQLGSRRQLDFDLDARGTCILDNLNRLAQTEQTTRPVHDTLEYYLGGTGAAPYGWVRTQMLQRLIRMKALDAGRLQGRFVIGLDATGHVSFRRPHCPHCLVTRHEHYTLYHHQVLEAKLLGPACMALSMASEFIDNSDANPTLSGEERKQDCELKALSRLLPALRREFPQLSLCLAGDGLYACGRTLQLAQAHDCAYVLTFKAGRLPALWQEFQTLLELSPQNTLSCPLPNGGRQVYRWVHDLSYQDSEGRTWTFHALQCQETIGAQTTTFAWITSLKVNARTVEEVATKGGRQRWHIENQGFNQQKNGGFNLEHVFSTDPELLKAYYYLLQIAHMMLQVLQVGSLLRRLAADCQRTPWQLFGSLKNLARRLLECFRYFTLADHLFDAHQAARLRISLDST